MHDPVTLKRLNDEAIAKFNQRADAIAHEVAEALRTTLGEDGYFLTVRDHEAIREAVRRAL